MNLDLRSLHPAWTCTPSLVQDTHQSLVVECRPADGPVHSLWIGDRRVTLDLSTGVGYEHNIDRNVSRALSRAEARLVLLDWSRGRMPVPSPTALWIVEAASLAAAGSERHWREWASVDLQEALAAFLDSPIEWTDATRDLIGSAMAAAAVDSIAVDGNALRSIARELEAVVAARWDCENESAPAPESVAGCSEVEWDRVDPVGVDLGELGLRTRIFGTVWTASIAKRRRGRRGDGPERLWARLVDDPSGLVYDEVEMSLANGLYVARGYVPPFARATGTRIDLTADPSLAVRTNRERRHLLSDQGWVRALFFHRRGSGGSEWAEWTATYRSRFGVEPPVSAKCSSRPFLAEWHLRPTDLASASQRLLSPGPGSAPPSKA